MKHVDRNSFVRSKNRNILLSRDLQSQSRMYKSNQKPNDFQTSIQLGLIKQDKFRGEPKFQLDLKRNPQLNILRGTDRNPKFQQPKPIKCSNKSSFQKTATGFNKQCKQYSNAKFYQTSINGFLITNNRPMSKKNNREKLKSTHRVDYPYQQGLEDQSQSIQSKESIRYPVETQLNKEYCIKRPETSKGQRKRGHQNKHTEDDDLMNQLIPEIFQQPQLFRFGKKEECYDIPIQIEKKKRNHPLSAVQKKSRDVTDLIKVNGSTQRKSVNDFVVPFQTTLSPEFICLFANGK